MFWFQNRPFLWTCGKAQHFVLIALPFSFSNCLSEAVAAGLQQHCEIIMIRHGLVVLCTNMATKARGREEQWPSIHSRLKESLQ